MSENEYPQNVTELNHLIADQLESYMDRRRLCLHETYGLL